MAWGKVAKKPVNIRDKKFVYLVTIPLEKGKIIP